MSNVPPSDHSRKRKRQKLGWNDLPDFCDAAASVTASTFGARRLPEMKELWSATFKHGVDSISSAKALESGGGKTSSRHLRRRATGHNARNRHRFPTGRPKAAVGNLEELSNTISRRARRKNADTLQRKHLSWCSAEAAPESDGDDPMRTILHWLPTHVWHAKRFHMQDLWGWKVPMIHNNRGAKAAVRLALEGKTLIQDTTWRMQPIWFSVEGSSTAEIQNALVRIVPTVNVLSPSAVFGRGTLHHIDQFPSGAISPISWLVTKTSIFSSAKAQGNHTFAYFWIHPSARDEAFQCIRQVLEKSTGVDGPHSFIADGLACLKLTGRESVKRCQDAMERLIKTSSNTDNDPSQRLFNDEAGEQIDGKVTTIRLNCAESEAAASVAVAILQYPNNPADPCNYGTCGVDLLCSPLIAKELFLLLVMEGGACPLGLAEDSHLSLECEPPLSLFPRDFPDSKEGQAVWSGTSKDWKIVTRHLNGGLGRIGAGKKAVKIEWSQLVSGCESMKDPVVVVRGNFGAPFQQCLSNLVTTMDNEQRTIATRRPRRRTKAPGSVAMAQKLGVEDASKHRGLCSTLLHNLSLPALLRCHIYLDGKGVATPGAILIASEVPTSAPPLGFVVAGVFSPSRGCCHGTAIIGAAQFLEGISRQDAVALTTRLSTGFREIRLQIRVSHQTCSYAGSIALLF